MTIYKISHNNVIIEFASLEAAQNYANLHNIDYEQIGSEEREQPTEFIPDVTPRQIRQALVLSGVTMQSIDDALNTLPEPTKSLAIAEWEYSIAFQRNRPLVDSVRQMLGWTNEQVDDLWRLAATL